jgi:multidrug transporter EmrE-like cation transporter
MLSITEIASLVLVGAFWGCTNPLLRKGSTEVAVTDAEQEKESSLIKSLTKQLAKFRHVSVWLPYALNQTGSILFYFTLSQTDLSLAVPACNALSLVFSIVTSWWIIGERIHQPVQTVLGAALVVGGVALCLHASETTPPEARSV